MNSLEQENNFLKSMIRDYYKSEIERLYSIIKEVREYCENDDNFQIIDLYSQVMVDGIQRELLEILDKVDKEK